MSKKYSFVVFGAYGYTGKIISSKIAEQIPKWNLKEKQIKWAVVGRSEEKLKGIIVSSWINQPDVLVADADNLDQICQETQILINCVGPYILYGEKVVRACLNGRTHYLDISGEEVFLNRMISKYHKEAVEKKILIMPECGFHSIVGMLGMMRLAEELNSRIGKFIVKDTAEYIKYCTIGPGRIPKANYGTYHSYILDSSQKKGFPFKSISSIIKYMPKWIGKRRKWAVCMHQTAERNERLEDMKKEHLTSNDIPIPSQYALVNGFIMIVILFQVSLIYIMARIRILRNIILARPSLFSNGMFDRLVTYEDHKYTSFEMVLGANIVEISPILDCPIGIEIEHEIVIRGPEAGYTTTGICTALCLDMLINHKTDFTPGVTLPRCFFAEDAETVMKKAREMGLVIK